MGPAGLSTVLECANFKLVMMAPNNHKISPLLAASLLLVMSMPLHGKTASSPKQSAGQWGAAWQKSQSKFTFSPGRAAGILRCAIVKKVDEQYTALTPDPTTALSESFLQTPSTQEVQLALEGNRTTSNDPDILKAPAHCEKSLENAAACYGADSILDVTDNTWRLYQFNRVTNKSIKILEGPAGSAGTYFTWIRKQLRYDGMVLDEKDGFLLALIPNQRYPRDSQALTIRNSSQKILVSASESKGSGLIQLHSYEGQFAIFQLVVAKRETSLFAPGTKLIVQSLPR
jgi:hypothetical protein